MKIYFNSFIALTFILLTACGTNNKKAEKKSEKEESSTVLVENEALCSSTTEPTIGDTATINSDQYKITAVKKIQPAATVVFYELRIAS